MTLSSENMDNGNQEEKHRLMILALEKKCTEIKNNNLILSGR